MRKSNVEIYRIKAVLLLVALLATIAVPPDAHADDVLVLEHDNIEFSLHGDICSPLHPAARIAYAKPLDGTDIALGCWYRGKMNTYVIMIDRGNGEQETYQFYKDKFSPRKDKSQ